MAHLPESDDDAALHCRTHYLYESENDSGDEDVIMTPPTPVSSAPVPLPPHDLSTEVALFVASVAPSMPGHPDVVRDVDTVIRESESDFIWRTLTSAPFSVLERGPLLTSILFSDGRSRVMATADVDAFRRYAAATAPASVPLMPRPPPAPPRTPALSRTEPRLRV
jgi:hypothetical protein